MSEEWMNRIEKKIDGLGRKVDGVEAALGQHIDGIDGTLTRLTQRIDGVEATLGQRLDGVDGTLTRLTQRIDGVEATLGQRIDGVDGTLTRLTHRLDGVESTFGQRFDGLGTIVIRLEKEQHRQGVLLEKHSDDIKGVAESVIGLSERMDRGFQDVLTRLDDRATPLEAASRYFASKLPSDDPKPPKRARRKKPRL